MPYVKGKLDEYYETVSGGPGGVLFGDAFEDEEESEFESEDVSRMSRQHGWSWSNVLTYAKHIPLVQSRRIWSKFIKKAKTAFRTAYPYADGMYNAVLFAYQLAYMYNKTDYYSPWLQISGLEVRRMSPRDFVGHSCQMKHFDGSFSEIQLTYRGNMLKRKK